MSTSSIVEELVADARPFLDGPVDDLIALLDGLAALGSVGSPTPSPELARLLAGRPEAWHGGRPARPARRPRHVLAGLAAAAVAGLSVTGAAAVANELPPSMQRAVALFSENYLPFSFPRPADDAPDETSSSPASSGSTHTVSAPALRSEARTEADERPSDVDATAQGQRDRHRPHSSETEVRAPKTVTPAGAPAPKPQTGRGDGPAVEPARPPAPVEGGVDRPGKGPESGQVGGKPATPPGQSDEGPPGNGPDSSPGNGSSTTGPPAHASTDHASGSSGKGSGAGSTTSG